MRVREGFAKRVSEIRVSVVDVGMLLRVGGESRVGSKFRVDDAVILRTAWHPDIPWTGGPRCGRPTTEQIVHGVTFGFCAGGEGMELALWPRRPKTAPAAAKSPPTRRRTRKR